MLNSLNFISPKTQYNRMSKTVRSQIGDNSSFGLEYITKFRFSVHLHTGLATSANEMDELMLSER